MTDNFSSSASFSAGIGFGAALAIAALALLKYATEEPKSQTQVCVEIPAEGAVGHSEALLWSVDVDGDSAP